MKFLNDNRSLALILMILVLVVAAVNPYWVQNILGIIQSIVIIVLGIVATMYLWKRL